jgi:ribosomal protein L12E/L44/L45/RPP1/RPP2
MALYDGDAEITAAQINTLLAATNNKVAPYWPALFSSFLKGGRIETLIFSGGAGAAAGPAGPANNAPTGGDAPKEAKKEEKPKVEEVDALEGGMDMFGGGGGGDY